MNSIVVFNHFCELHGPSVLFCTQAFHSTHDPDVVLAGAGPSECASYFDGANFSTYSPAASDAGSVASYSAAAIAPLHSKASTCDSCKSLSPGHPGYLSNDHAAHISYVSGPYPQNSELYTAVRQACVRSLSCEVCPGREGPILFGDDKNGFVFSYSFFLRDTMARGSQRWYSICLLMSDRVHLVNSWPFLAGSIRLVVDDLQAKANCTFQADNAARNESAKHGGFALPADQMWRRRGNRTLRSLTDLTCDARLFANLHASFAWVLRTCASRLFEKQIEGPSMLCAAGDQWDPSLSGRLVVGDPDTSFLASEVAATGEVFCSLRHLYRTIGTEFFRAIVFNLSVGNQVIVRGAGRDTVSSILLLLRELLPPTCCAAVLYSRGYRDRWECNLLGLCPRASVPEYVDPSSYVMLDIRRKPDAPRRTQSNASTVGETDTSLGGAVNHADSRGAAPDSPDAGGGNRVRRRSESGIARALSESMSDRGGRSGSVRSSEAMGTCSGGCEDGDACDKKECVKVSAKPVFHAVLNDNDDITAPRDDVAGARGRGMVGTAGSSSRRAMPWDTHDAHAVHGDTEGEPECDFAHCSFVLRAGNHRESSSGNSFTRAMERVLGPDVAGQGKGDAEWWNPATISLLGARFGAMAVSGTARSRTSSAASHSASLRSNSVAGVEGGPTREEAGVDDAVCAQWLVALKEEWMNKAKLYFQFSRTFEGASAPQTPNGTGGHASAPSFPSTPIPSRGVHTPQSATSPATTPQAIVRIMSPTVRADGRVASDLSPASPAVSEGMQDVPSDNTARFLRIVGLAVDDLALLRFWTSGLSRQHRARLLMDGQHGHLHQSSPRHPHTPHSPYPIEISPPSGPKSRSASIPVSAPAGVVQHAVAGSTASSSPMAHSHSSNSAGQSYGAGAHVSSSLVGGTPVGASGSVGRHGSMGSVTGYAMSASLSKPNGLRY